MLELQKHKRPNSIINVAVDNGDNYYYDNETRDLSYFLPVTRIPPTPTKLSSVSKKVAISTEHIFGRAEVIKNDSHKQARIFAAQSDVTEHGEG